MPNKAPAALLSLAAEIAQKAYAPYSKIHVARCLPDAMWKMPRMASRYAPNEMMSLGQLLPKSFKR